jgi:hypothetical protein
VGIVEKLFQPFGFPHAFQFDRFAVFLPAAFIHFLVFPFFGISGPRFGFDVVPPHVFRTFPVGPRIFAGNGTCVAANALIEVENH